MYVVVIVVVVVVVDFSIQVLSSGSWPFQQSAPFSLPAEVCRLLCSRGGGGVCWLPCQPMSVSILSYYLTIIVFYQFTPDGKKLSALHNFLQQSTQRAQTSLALSHVQGMYSGTV